MTLRVVTRVIAGRRVAVSCASGQEPLAEDVLSTLARIGERDPLRPGMRVRFGWSVLTLREQETGALIACEPDFDGSPLADVRPQVVTTLEVLARQAVLLRRVGATPVDVGFEQFVLVARGALTSSRLHLFRAEAASGDDSGWTVSSSDHPGVPDDPTAFEATRVFTFLRSRPVVLSVLGLPPEFAVVTEGEEIEAVLDEDGRHRL